MPFISISVGIKELLANGVYKAAYPLHEVTLLLFYADIFVPFYA